MSRGLGQLQGSIRDYLVAEPAHTTYETLRWALFEQQTLVGRPGRLRGGRLPSSWNTSLKRALEGLAAADKPHVVTQRRRLESMAELVTHYPGKSLVSSTRKLRRDLLPALVIIAETKNQTPRYTQADNESFLLGSFAADKRTTLQKAWQAIAPELIHHLQNVGGNDQLTLFLLIARGKSLFEAAPLECGMSIAQCVEPLFERAGLPLALQRKLSSFSASVAAAPTIGHLRLKSYIRSFVDIPQRGRGYRLTAATLDQLDDVCREVLKTLPGYEYRPPPSKKSISWLMHVGPRSQHSPEIHKLIDKTVFETFCFIRPI
jgi:hypothetical protein